MHSSRVPKSTPKSITLEGITFNPNDVLYITPDGWGNMEMQLTGGKITFEGPFKELWRDGARQKEFVGNLGIPGLVCIPGKLDDMYEFVNINHVKGVEPISPERDYMGTAITFDTVSKASHHNESHQLNSQANPQDVQSIFDAFRAGVSRA